MYSEEVRGIDAIIQFNFTGEEGESWYLTIRNEGCTSSPGVAQNPDLTLTCPSDVWLSIAWRKRSPVEALGFVFIETSMWAEVADQ